MDFCCDGVCVCVCGGGGGGGGGWKKTGSNMHSVLSCVMCEEPRRKMPPLPSL